MMSRRLKISLLLFFFALCGAAVLATHVARSRTSPSQARELFSVVSRQLSAFRAADFGSAYRHSAAGVQQKFSLAQFERMVRRDFASMTQAGRVEFGAVRVTRASALVQVFLIAPDGAVRGFLYSFTAEADGWKIDGVQSLGAQPERPLPGRHVERGRDRSTGFQPVGKAGVSPAVAGAGAALDFPETEQAGSLLSAQAGSLCSA